MSGRLERLTNALAPVMNKTQAEGFLHLTAVSCGKRPEALSFDDWPAVEQTMRDALHGTPSAARADEICARLRDAFLAESDAAGC